MKNSILFILLILLVSGCSTTSLVNSNINYTNEGKKFEQTDTYKPWWKN